jgi:uncharacterized 2Fe-2S/4Fe-4S cluster protein (DUF4445 family)
VIAVHQAGLADRSFAATEGASLLEVLRGGGVGGLDTPCGGEGTCGKCVLRLRQGDDVARYALACRVAAAAVHEVWLEEPPQLVIQTDFRPPAWVPAAVAGDLDGYRVVIDVGTTTVAAVLLAPRGARIVARVSDRNQQAGYGADVISRITRSDELGVGELSGVLREQFRELTGFLLDSAGVPAEAVTGYAIAGNTVMEHFVAGLSPSSIGTAPFEPLSRFGDERPAASLGLPGAAGAAVYLLPAVAGYVGGDITADALACGLDAGDRVVCLLDLGTNGEIALRTPDGLVACATAAGPAFEGAQIECGMPAVAGAIDRVTAAAGQLRISTVLGAAPIGICGSGLVDALAAAVRLGLVEETGRLRSRGEVRESLAGYLTPEGSPPRLLLTEDGSVFLSQRDVRQLQLAKGAIAAGLDVLLADSGLDPADVDSVLLAGGFGTRVRPASLATIGMIPAEWAKRASAVGNAALAGAIATTAEPRGRFRAEAVAGSCRYLELSQDHRFTEAFMERIGFGAPGIDGLAGALAAARDLGFEEAHELDVATLEPLPEVRVMCAADRCHSFGRNWACPPGCGDLSSFAAQFAGFGSGILVQTVGVLEDPFDLDGMTSAERVHKRRLLKLVEVLGSSYPRELPLGVGPCALCPVCTYPDQPCRLPGLRIVSMEAAGLLVAQVCERNGVPYYHGPSTVTYTSCVLLE